MAGYTFTKERKRQEILKCGRDPVYFINNYVKIAHPLKGLIPFNCFDYQEQLLKDFKDHRYTVVLKARQLGISTIVAAFIAWMMLFHRDKNILVMATKFQTAGNLVKKVKAMIKHLPPWMKIAGIKIDNRVSFILTNGSEIKASSTTSDAGRSEALSLLVIDEAAHIEGLDELWTGLQPTLSTGGTCIALSSPNGVDNWFFDTYTKASLGDNEFYPVKLMWDVHPERDKAWFDKETRNLSRRQIAQELLCNFNMSGDTVFDATDIEFIEKNQIVEPKYKTAFDRNLWIWNEAQLNETYLLVADVARGDGEDNSAAHVFIARTMEQVAEYQGKATPDVFANLLYNLGYEYNKCLLVVENNIVGFNVVEKLIERGYPNIYFSQKGSHEYVEQYTAETSNSTSIIGGFSTTSTTRPLIVAKMEEYIRNKHLILKSARLLFEIKNFIWKNGKPIASRTKTDDLIMAAAIACWVRDTALEYGERNMAYKKAFLSMGAVIRTNSILDTTVPGMMKHDPSKNKLSIESDNFTKYLWLYTG